jgi:hypothetical protein
MKKPTASGIRMKMIERQSSTNPTVGGSVPEFVTPFSSVLYGMLPAAVKAPKTHRNNPGHPHNNAAAAVAIMAFVLLSITYRSFEI